MSESLSISRENFAALTEQFPYIMFIIERGKVVFVNRRVEQILGFHPDDWLAPAFDLKSIIASDPERKTEEIYDLLISKTAAAPGEITFIHKNGKKVRATVDKDSIRYNRKDATLVITRDVSTESELEFFRIKDSDRLVSALGSAIEAVANAMKFRDPYVSEHQHRVTQLAHAISREMHLKEHECEIIRQAAAVHDIGKIYIPVEVLIKPPALSDLELSLIRMHPRVGSDIVKRLELTWPIADIVLQHHERLDGSGYPRKISGENILLAARVIGVADVVEAISHDRPYRTALSLDLALDEIRMNRGKLYDASVVDACINLFYYKNFQFEPDSEIPGELTFL